MIEAMKRFRASSDKTLADLTNERPILLVFLRHAG